MLSKEGLQEAIQQFLRDWRKGDRSAPPLLTGLRLYGRLRARTEALSLEPTNLTGQLLGQVLQDLQERDEVAASLMRRRYLEDTPVSQLTRELAISESQYYNWHDKAISQLSDMILAQEGQLLAEHQLAVEARLELQTYRQLFGVDQTYNCLGDLVMRDAPPYLIALDGIGGIGKTSLADKLVRELIGGNRFYDLAWVSAKQEIFLPAAGLQATPRPALDTDALIDALLNQLDGQAPARLPPQEKMMVLIRLLKKQPYLVIVDNLETMADYQALLPTLHQLADPTKFVLTTRHNLAAEARLFCLSLEELSARDTLAFLRHEAEARGLEALLEAAPAQLAGVYEVVGGNPLALKLVVGQICALPLSQVLANLKQAQGQKVDQLYTFIYWQTWQTLASESRQALLAMPLVSRQGGTFAHLAAVSELGEAELSQALDELVALSLVEVGGEIERRRYRIHRLTETFLLTEVTKWQSPR